MGEIPYEAIVIHAGTGVDDSVAAYLRLGLDYAAGEDHGARIDPDCRVHQGRGMDHYCPFSFESFGEALSFGVGTDRQNGAAAIGDSVVDGTLYPASPAWRPPP